MATNRCARCFTGSATRSVDDARQPLPHRPHHRHNKQARRPCRAFWPPGHRFFGTPQAIAPGQVAVLNLGMPGGAVIYADDHAFTLTAPAGHMFAGIIAFSAYAGEEGVTVAQIQALVRPSDPLYELGCRLGFGHTQADQFWHATLRNLAARFGAQGQPQQRRTLVDPRIRWAEASNLWQNAAIRRTSHMPVSLGQKLMRSFT